MDNLIIMSTTIGKQRQDHKNTYILYANAEKMFWQALAETQFNRDRKNGI